jgi:hypothetical protein
MLSIHAGRGSEGDAPHAGTLIARLSKLDSQYLALSPNDQAASRLTTLKKGELKSIRNCRRRCEDDFGAVI